MGNGVRATEALAGLRSEGIGQRMDARLRRLDLMQRSGAVRRLVDLSTRGV